MVRHLKAHIWFFPKKKKNYVGRNGCLQVDHFQNVDLYRKNQTTYVSKIGFDKCHCFLNLIKIVMSREFSHLGRNLFYEVEF